MILSKTTVSVLVDLIENKLALMDIGDRDELREVLTLQRCLAELREQLGQSGPSLCDLPEKAIPHRGRRRKLSALMEEMDVHPQDHRAQA